MQEEGVGRGGGGGGVSRGGASHLVLPLLRPTPVLPVLPGRSFVTTTCRGNIRVQLEVGLPVPVLREPYSPPCPLLCL